MPEDEIKGWFPNADQEGFRITSENDPAYNCIAWAGDDNTQKWDPEKIPGRFWPEGLARDKKVETFVKLFEICGNYEPFEPETEILEPGFDKIAIFCEINVNTLEREVTHAAKQLPSGKWTSKLGECEDIEHNSLKALEGSWYGTAVKILRRGRVVTFLP